MHLARFAKKRMRFLSPVILFCFLIGQPGSSQDASQSVSIRVRSNQPDGPISSAWNYFGYDEPNYTYTANGRKLLGELAALGTAPVYVRVHNLLTSGDGTASLKWGSTNVYSEDASGKPIYSWTILDRIFDTFRDVGVKPLGRNRFHAGSAFYPS